MKLLNLATTSICALALLHGSPAKAGEIVTSSKGSAAVTPPVEEEYEANRGLLTLQGPTGMFINPTSATLPQGAFTVQACLLLPDFDFGGNTPYGGLVAYGVTDWLEVGGNVLFVDLDNADTLFSAGPLVRVRLLKRDGWIPQLSVGGYGKIGDDPIESANAFVALTQRLEVDAGPLESIAVHAGVRETWNHEEFGGDTFRGYFGVEFQLPYRLYLVGEIATEADNDTATPWAAGIQWRAGGINISAAVVNSIETETLGDEEVGFFFGIGTQF